MELTPAEVRALRAASDSAPTLRHRRTALVTGGAMLAVLLGAVLVPVSRELVLAAFAVYVVAVIIERIAYANSVLTYKSLVCKLAAQHDTTNGGL